MAEVGELLSSFHCIEWRIKEFKFHNKFTSKRFFLCEKAFQLSISPDHEKFYYEIKLNFIGNHTCPNCGYWHYFTNENNDMWCYVSCYAYFPEDPLVPLTVAESIKMKPFKNESIKVTFPEYQFLNSARGSTSSHQPSNQGISLGKINAQFLAIKKLKTSSDGTLKIVLKFFNEQDNTLNVEFSSERKSTLVQNFEKLFLSEREADILIKVKGSQFRSHRLILAARSEVFAAMFQQDMIEKRSGEVEINDCDPDCFKNFLLYLYTEKKDLITLDNALSLHYLADKYAIEDLKKCCILSLMKNLSTDLICDVLTLAATYGDSNLLKAATNFFCENTEKILKTTKWLDFQKKQLELSNDLLLKSFTNLKSNLKPG